MPEYVVLLSVPGLRGQDVDAMPRLQGADGRAAIGPSWRRLSRRHLPRAGEHDHRPAAQRARRRRQRLLLARPRRSRNVDLAQRLHRAAAALGHPARAVARRRRPPCGFRCTARIAAPTTSARRRRSTTPTAASRCGATRGPTSLYGELRRRARPLSAAALLGADGEHQVDGLDRRRRPIRAAERFRPNLFYIYLPHLDYAAQKYGPDSAEAQQARRRARRRDRPAGRRLRRGVRRATPLWLVASEYVDHAGRSRALSQPRAARRRPAQGAATSDAGELIDFAASQAWALVDHQFSHVFVQDADPATIERVAELFAGQPGVAEVFDPQRCAAVRPRPPAQRRAGRRQRAEQLAGLLLVDRRRPGARRSPAPSISTASRATTRSSCSSTPRPRASRSMPTLVKGSHGAPPLDAVAARRAALQPARRVRRRPHRRHRRRRHRAAAVRHLTT